MHWSTESSILESLLKFVFVFVPNFESWKKHLFLLFLRSLSITDFNNLESRKRNCCFGKKSWFLDPKNQLRTLILKVMYWLLSPLSMLKLPLMAESECAPLIMSLARCQIQICLLINYIILELGLFWKLIIRKLKSIT